MVVQNRKSAADRRNYGEGFCLGSGVHGKRQRGNSCDFRRACIHLHWTYIRLTVHRLSFANSTMVWFFFTPPPPKKKKRHETSGERRRGDVRKQHIFSGNSINHILPSLLKTIRLIQGRFPVFSTYDNPS